MRRLLGCLALVVVWLGVPTIAGAAEVKTLFVLDDHRLDELSGIARGKASPGVFYVQNDSGDKARFFALDAISGQVLADYHVPGADNVDWEDLAVAPDAAGRPSVWLADIGDNDSKRDHVTLYRVDEPHVQRVSGSVQTRRPDVWQLRYPGGPANAESLAVSPQGRAYVITKRPDGRSAVFAVPAAPSDTPQTLRQIATITLAAQPSLVPADLQRDATGAALSRDGTRFVLRTYTDAYLWQVSKGDLAAALERVPTRLTLPLQPQGEGICFDGNRLVLDSEHRGSAVLAVPLPGAAAPTTTSAPTTNSAPPTSATPPEPSGTSPGASHTDAAPPGPPADSSATDSDKPLILVCTGSAVVVLVGVAALFVGRRRRRQG